MTHDTQNADVIDRPAETFPVDDQTMVIGCGVEHQTIVTASGLPAEYDAMADAVKVTRTTRWWDATALIRLANQVHNARQRFGRLVGLSQKLHDANLKWAAVQAAVLHSRDLPNIDKLTWMLLDAKRSKHLGGLGPGDVAAALGITMNAARESLGVLADRNLAEPTHVGWFALAPLAADPAPDGQEDGGAGDTQGE